MLSELSITAVLLGSVAKVEWMTEIEELVCSRLRSLGQLSTNSANRKFKSAFSLTNPARPATRASERVGDRRER